MSNVKLVEFGKRVQSRLIRQIEAEGVAFMAGRKFGRTMQYETAAAIQEGAQNFVREKYASGDWHGVVYDWTSINQVFVMGATHSCRLRRGTPS